jgi:hypothetical protein
LPAGRAGFFVAFGGAVAFVGALALGVVARGGAFGGGVAATVAKN